MQSSSSTTTGVGIIWVATATGGDWVDDTLEDTDDDVTLEDGAVGTTVEFAPRSGKGWQAAKTKKAIMPETKIFMMFTRPPNKKIATFYFSTVSISIIPATDKQHKKRNGVKPCNSRTSHIDKQHKGRQ